MQDQQETLGNPYKEEIEDFDYKISNNNEDLLESLKVPEEAKMYGTLEQTPLTYVETLEQLVEMKEKL